SAGTIADLTGNVFPAAVPSSGATPNTNAIVNIPDVIPPRLALQFTPGTPQANPPVPIAKTWSFSYTAPTASTAGSFTLNFDEPIFVGNLAAGSIALSGVQPPVAAPTTTAGITDSTGTPFTLTMAAT